MEVGRSLTLYSHLSDTLRLYFIHSPPTSQRRSYRGSLPGGQCHLIHSTLNQIQLQLSLDDSTLKMQMQYTP